MAGYRPSNLTGATDWFGTLSQLKRALSLGITERRISDEFFVFDLLKGVCEDGVDEGTRVELLTFLEEHGHLIIGAENVEQVLASLLDIFHQGRKRGASGTFTCQLLTTLITVLVEFDQLSKSVEVCSRIVTTLLSVISQVNDVTDLLLRSHALTCLLELEINYPTLLRNKLPSLYNLVKSEGSWLYQDYVQLFTKTLQHALMELASSSDSVTDSKLTDILCNRKEQLKECPDLQTPFFSSTSKGLVTGHNSFDSGLQAKEIRQAVSLFTEQSLLFTPSGLASIIRSLVSIVGYLPSLSPIVFKPLVLQHLSTMDPCLLQLIMMLRRSFPGVLLSDVEETALLQQFLCSLHHPGYTAAHRLLLYQWLFQYDTTHQMSESDSLPVRLTEQNYGDLFPSVFDGVDSQLVKLRALNLCIHPGPVSDLASAVLMSSLVYLHKTVQHNSSGRAAVALFRALYSFYRQHLHSCLPKDIKQFIIGLVSNSVQLVPHVINFLDALSQLPESSGVYLEILSALHRQVVQAATSDVTSQLDYVLQVLRKAATETQINPKSTLNFLSRLLRTAPQLLQGDWGYGNGVLAVARNILQYHSTDLIFHDMGGLFHSMMTHYGDVDVKDKARFYYALLTSAADEKIALVLTDPTTKNGTSTNNIQNIVSGPGGFLNQTTLTEVEKSPLCWNRLSQENSWYPKLPEMSEKIELSSEESMKSYKKQLQHYTPRLEYKFQLKMVDNCDFDQLLAITVQVETNSNWEHVKDVHVSCLLASEEKEISLCLMPKLPIPTSFPASVMFTSSDSRTYVSQLEPLRVGFSDFFLPLPVELWPAAGKKQLFYSLWHHIVDGDHTDDSSSNEVGVQSVYIAGCEMTRIENALQGNLKPFVVDSNPDENLHLVGMLLPGRYHLLMRIEQVEGRVVVNTATDLWSSLTAIQTFLDNLSTSQTVQR